MRTVLHVISWLILSFWLVAIASPGVAAMSAFTQLPAEGAEIPTYRAFFGEDQAAMGRMVAGYVTDPIFRATDLIQCFLAPAALLFALLEWRPFRIARGPWQLIRIFALSGALGLVLLHTTSMAPRMAAQLDAYRTAAAEDNREVAEASHAAFDQDHQVAGKLFEFRMVLILVAIVASAAAVTLPNPKDGAAP